MMAVAREMEVDIPDCVTEAIADGSFETFLQDYDRERLSKSRNKDFLDIGDYSLKKSFKEKIDMYQTLKQHEKLVQRLRMKAWITFTQIIRF